MKGNVLLSGAYENTLPYSCYVYESTAFSANSRFFREGEVGLMDGNF